MPISFRLKATNTPPGQQCISTVQGMLQAVEQYMLVVGPDGISGTVISIVEPSVDDRDKTWLKLESNGFPVGLYKYQNGWVQVPGLHKGAIILYNGPVADIPAGWVLADGTNGAPDLTDNTAYASLWNPNHPTSTGSYFVAPIWFKGFAP